MAKFNIDGAKIISRMGSKFSDNAIRAYEETAIQEFGDMFEQTPLGINNSERSPSQGPKGNVRFNWQISRKPNTRVLLGSGKKDRATASKGIKGKLKGGKSLYIFNNHPAIRVIEFGGYPNPVKKGTYRKGIGFEKRSSGGFSKQAPTGLVRIRLRNFSGKFRTRLKAF